MKGVLPLVIILIVGGLLRLQRINQPYVDMLGWREASTAMMADNLYRGETDLLRPAVRWMGPGKGYQAREFQTVTGLAAILYCAFGKVDWVGRAVVVSFGLWGILVLYFLTLRLWGRHSAIASAAILAVMPGAVFLDRCFIPDPAMAALATTSLWLLAEWRRLNRWYLLGLASSAWTLACLTKLQALTVIIPAGYLVWHAPFFPNQKARLGPALQVAAALLIPLAAIAAYYVWTLHVAMSQDAIHIAGEHKYLWGANLAHWWSSGYFLPIIAGHVQEWMWTMPVMMLTTVGLLLMPPSEATCPTPFVFHWWALGTAILYLVEAEHMASDPQNMAILNPIAAAFAGLPVSSLFNWTCRRAGGRVAAALTCVVVLVVAVVGQMKTRNLYVDSYLEMHELGSELAQLADPDDLVISLGLEPIAIYYSGLRGWVFPPPETWHDPDSRLWRDSFERIDAIEHLRLRGASWLLIPMSSYWGDLLIDYLDNHCELVRHSAAGYLYRMMGE